MNKFLDDLFKSEEHLVELDKWSQDFWEMDDEKIKPIFAQRGYEDKGYGHTRRIIANVGDFLEKYFKTLGEENGAEDLDAFAIEQRKKLEKCLILFYIVAHLHDIGMNFPGIFKALSHFVEEGGENALHIGKIIHDHHHYASFVVLLEMSFLKELDADTKEDRPYFSNIPDSRFERAERFINKLIKILNKIFQKHFLDDFPYFDKKDGYQHFKVILAILSLLHKGINETYLRSILKKFKEKKMDESVEFFNFWHSHIERSRQWTDRIHQRFLRAGGLGEMPESSDYEILKLPHVSENILDILFVEALLQYGDKTEITIARLARQPEGYYSMPLENFIDDTQYDYQKRSICTTMAQEVVSNFARLRACCYIPVPLITVDKVEQATGMEEETTADNGEQETGKEEVTRNPELNVVIHYLRFDGDEDIFKFIRLNNEKDFFDLRFLLVIRFHLPLLLQPLVTASKSPLLRNPVFTINFKKEEHSFNEKSDMERLFNIFPYDVDSFGDIQKIFEKIDDIPGNLENISKKITEAINAVDSDDNTPLYELKQLVRELPPTCTNRKKIVDAIRNLLKECNEGAINKDQNRLHLIEFKGRWETYSQVLVERKESFGILEELFHNSFPSAYRLNNQEDLMRLMKELSGKAHEKKKEHIELLKGLTDKLKMKLVTDDGIILLTDHYPDTLRGVNLLRKRIKELKKEWKDKNLKDIDIGELFPYTPFNRQAIFEMYRDYRRQMEAERSGKGSAKVFYETCDLIVPASFELLAVLNLFFWEKEG